MTTVDPGASAKKYIADVLAGKIVVGRLIRLAVKRHVNDLKEGKNRGLWFDEKAAGRAIKFFGFLRHSKGEWGKSGGLIFELSPWQAFIVWCAFGWKRTKDGSRPKDPKTDRPRSRRRFRVSYAEIARKNGKSTFAAGIALYLLVGDGEPGAEVYTAATKREQAKIVHSEATRMVKKSPALKEHVGVAANNLHVDATASKFEPLGADADTMDGLNVHGAVIDELHQHRTRGVWDSLDTATGSREQPLIFSITTAGFNRHSVCWEEREYSIKILEAACGERTDVPIDDSRFVFIAALDEGDDWQDERVWAKANPNLGVSVKLEDLRSKAKVAVQMASYRNAFLTKHLNVWTDAQTAWLNTEKWNACNAAVELASLNGRVCFGGLDLSNKIDLSAFVLVFPPTRDDPLWRILPHFWIPEETAEEHENQDRVPYRAWRDAGLIEFTPGNVVDYEFIEHAILDSAKRYTLVEVAFDSWNATATANRLQAENIAMQEFIQGARSFSEPCKEFERLMVSKKLAHAGHKVLGWNASCVAIQTDANGNIRPVKPAANQAGKRIDGIVATLMALGLAIRAPEEQESVYEHRGIVTA